MINKIIPFSSVDGPGNRTAIFLQGCNFNCKYCHNPETINICNNCGECVKFCKFNALKLKNNKINYNQNNCVNCDECIKHCKYNSSPKVIEYTVSTLVNEILKYKNFIRGITFSGGECSINHLFITQFAKEIKQYNLDVYVDTNGYIDFTSLNDFVNIVDKFMLDVKAFDRNIHKKLTGKTNETVLKNLKFLIKNNKIYEIRTVLIKEIDYFDTINYVVPLIKDTNIRYKLIKYRKYGVRKKYKNLSAISDDEIKKIIQLFPKYFNFITV
ncbi:pyruvate formate lyase activating enzyme [Hypnocyclicus thermotrophus]|uniref:Pyruvate formate lyase activating enzyme n=1 Tax=Hypnocyclicus thermotrophus TaxID=1627895 RepID=A0AA46DXF5_9FUSO|nr:pyruvate formate lyase activating enzyme [Hypnocyclicus thermotrophus]